MSPDPDDWETHWTNQGTITSRNPAQRFRHRLVVELVKDARVSSVIDIGAGQGDLLHLMASRFPEARLAGVELSASGASITRSKVPRADVREADLIVDDYVPTITDFECLTCVEVLEHLDNPEQLLRSALLHLTPGGLAILTVPSGPRTAFDLAIGHRRHFSRRTIREVMSNAGLIDISVRRAGFPFFNLYRIVVLLRGKRLIEDISKQSLDSSKFALGLMKVFDVLMHMNIWFVPLGWQIVATGRKPN